MKGLNLRVYRRTLEGIALLWNKKVLEKEVANDIVVTADMGDGEEKKLSFKTSEQVSNNLTDGMTTPDNTNLMMISHEQNKLDPYKDVQISIKFGEKVYHEILVYGFGILPPLEKDDKKANSHIYGFVDSERKWAKLPLIRCADGTLAVPMVIKKES